MVSGINSAAQLMSDSAGRFDLAAHNLANINTQDLKALRMDGARVDNDPAGQIVDSINASGSYKLGVSLMNTGDQMLKTLIDLKA